MAREVLASPQCNPGSIIDGVYRNHRVRISERYGARRSCLPQRVEERIVEKALDVRRSQIVPRSAAMETHVNRPARHMR